MGIISKDSAVFEIELPAESETLLEHIEDQPEYESSWLCWDNSVMERFFRSLKSERLNHLSFIHHVAAVSIVESYIFIYNYKRLHSSLGYITPVQKNGRIEQSGLNLLH
jgi:putative transposase